LSCVLLLVAVFFWSCVLLVAVFFWVWFFISLSFCLLQCWVWSVMWLGVFGCCNLCCICCLVCSAGCVVCAVCGLRALFCFQFLFFPCIFCSFPSTSCAWLMGFQLICLIHKRKRIQLLCIAYLGKFSWMTFPCEF
jgi:hypothetical protein